MSFVSLPGRSNRDPLVLGFNSLGGTLAGLSKQQSITSLSSPVQTKPVADVAAADTFQAPLFTNAPSAANGGPVVLTNAVLVSLDDAVNFTQGANPGATVDIIKINNAGAFIAVAATFAPAAVVGLPAGGVNAAIALVPTVADRTLAAGEGFALRVQKQGVGVIIPSLGTIVQIQPV